MQANRGTDLAKNRKVNDVAKRLKEALRGLPLFRPGLRIGVGVSGGADSVALLRLLMESRAELGAVVSAVHFNHQLRGKASDGDERFVAELAEEQGVTLHVGRADVAGKAKRERANLEDAARRARYGFFRRLAEQGIVDVVATAHTMDDQAETVLAHIIRGTGIAGLAGIHPISENVVRPLLKFRRDELRQYLRMKKKSWREDASNRDTTRTRARMRQKLFPLLKKQFNPEVSAHLAALAQRAQEQNRFMETLVNGLLDKHVQFSGAAAQIAISKMLDPLAMGSDLATAEPRARLVVKIAERIRQRGGQISAVHVEAIVQLAKSGEPGKRVQIPGGIDVLRERDALVFRPRRGLP